MMRKRLQSKGPMLRRRLDRARLATPNPEVIKALAAHFSRPSPETSSILELPALIARNFQLRQTLAFRSNTTECFRAAIEATFIHNSDHRSRHGEEGAGAVQILSHPFGLSNRFGTLIYADVDHPSMRHMAEVLMSSPQGVLRRVELSDLIYAANGPNPTTEIINRYSQVLQEEIASVVLLPHVVWSNGAVLDIRAICRALRAIDSLCTVVVDGAQAVGHINIDIEEVQKENEDIDFYLGCGHKWLGGPETVGFMRVGRRFDLDCSQCRDLLSASDLLTDSSGLALHYTGEQIGTHQRGTARALARSIFMIEGRPGGFQKVYSDCVKSANSIRQSLLQCKKYISLDPPEDCRSAVVAFTTISDDFRPLGKLARSLENKGFWPAIYPLENHPEASLNKRSFIRLSPGPDLQKSDLKLLSDILTKG